MYEVKLKIQKESDLYEPLSPDKELSGDVISYLEQKIDERNRRERLLFHIISSEPVDEQNVRAVLSAWRLRIERSLKKQRQANWTRQLRMFVIGIVFTALGVLLELNENTVSFTVLSAIGGFAMWDAASVWISENPLLRKKERMLQQLSEDYALRIEVEE